MYMYNVYIHAKFDSYMESTIFSGIVPYKTSNSGKLLLISKFNIFSNDKNLDYSINIIIIIYNVIMYCNNTI